jgi:LPXTG-motif cell wall-anchored protein
VLTFLEAHMTAIRNPFTILTVGTVLLSGIAHAQAPAADAAGAAPGPGTVTNETTTETVTTTSPDAIGVDAGTATGEPLPNTGGAPLVMALGGIILAGGSLLLRRKLV